MIYGVKEYLNKHGMAAKAMQWSGFAVSEMKDFAEVAIKRGEPFTLRNGDIVTVSDYVIDMNGYKFCCMPEVFKSDYTKKGSLKKYDVANSLI